MSDKENTLPDEKAEKAVALFNQGYNCAQAVLLVYAEELGLSREDATRLAGGFGAGMGRLQEVCGAATGAFMVLSMKLGSPKHDDAPSRERVYAAIQAFEKKFSKVNNSLICRELLGVNLLNGERAENAARVQSVCPKMVKDAVMILEELFAAEF